MCSNHRSQHESACCSGPSGRSRCQIQAASLHRRSRAARSCLGTGTCCSAADPRMRRQDTDTTHTRCTHATYHSSGTSGSQGPNVVLTALLNARATLPLTVHTSTAATTTAVVHHEDRIVLEWVRSTAVVLLLFVWHVPQCKCCGVHVTRLSKCRTNKSSPLGLESS